MIRIDLLGPEERRYMGPVSFRFAVRALLVTALAGLGIWAALAIYQGIECRSSLAIGRHRWQMLEPRYASLQQSLSRHEELNRYLDEAEGWRQVRLSLPGLMEELRARVPDEVQLVRLELRDEIAAPRPKIIDEVVTPYRQLRLRLAGRVQSERSEEIVARFVRGLRALDNGTELFSSVTLMGIQVQSMGGTAISTFDIDATGPQRPIGRAKDKKGT